MSLNERIAPISQLARQCLISFERCLRDTLNFDSQRYSTIEDDMARFSIWTSNMAVFASQKACLDHRVREAPEVQRLVLGILEILQGRIDECICLVERLMDPCCSIETRLSVLAQGDFERISDGISSEVGLLHELSNTIRKASRESQDVKAVTSFQMKDDEGNNIDDMLKEHFARNIRDCFPESSESIRDRLATTMILRRKRILYRRSRYAADPIKPLQPVIKPKIETQVVVPRQKAQEQHFSSQVIKPVAEPSEIYSIVQSATTLAPQSFQRASAPSVVSHIKSVNMGSHEDLVFPARLEVSSHSPTEVTCPYCLYVLSSLEASNEARWRKHVLGDLDALVCLFDPCDEPNVLYRHSKDWLLHMRQHTKRWRCSAKVHGIQDFSSREEYDTHLRESHHRNYTSAQLDLLAERGMRYVSPLFDICPLCGGKNDSDDNQIPGNLIDHIVGHLRSLALKSLPPHYDNNDTTSYNSHSDESVKSRSTVKSLLGDRSTLSLEWAQSILSCPANNEQDLIKKHMAQARHPKSVLEQEKPRDLSQPLLARLGIYYEEENEDHDRDTVLQVGPPLEDFIELTDQNLRRYISRLNPLLPTSNWYLVDRMVTHTYTCLWRIPNSRRRYFDSVSKSNYSSGRLALDRALPLKELELFNGDTRTFQRLKGNTNCRNLPLGFLMPQTVEFPAKFECPLCFQSYEFQSLSNWIVHVQEDLQPFTCTFDQCSNPGTFKHKIDWIRHENENHRHLEWWTCNVPACIFFCSNQNDFCQHLVGVHKLTALAREFPSRDAVLEKADECHKTTTVPPYNETCRFCDRMFPTWNRLINHIAEHLELICLLILRLLKDDPTYHIQEREVSLPSGRQNDVEVPPTGYPKTPLHVMPPLNPSLSKIHKYESTLPDGTEGLYFTSSDLSWRRM